LISISDFLLFKEKKATALVIVISLPYDALPKKHCLLSAIGIKGGKKRAYKIIFLFNRIFLKIKLLRK